ncbi:MAG: type II toxin-antitoxin system VapC family toxin [Deltaproteobacteria bacterium]|nr:type II toxin-antitoxin system VapC family toxin [Deltaproteobacteria bacterium]
MTLLYLDTSALVKLYVREHGSTVVRRRLDAAPAVATSRVAYPEARAAFARRRREGALSPRGLARCVSRLDADLAAFVVVELDAPIAHRAGEIAAARALRGFDAIHVASALALAALTGSSVAFVSFDARQAAAATAEGLAP